MKRIPALSGHAARAPADERLVSLCSTDPAPSAGRRPRLTRRGVLAGAVATGVLLAGGCQSTAPAGPPSTLAALVLAEPVAEVNQALAEDAARAAREAGARLALAVADSATLRASLTRAIAARQPPAVALVGSADSAPLAGQGLLRDLRERLERVAALNGDLFPPFRDLATAGPFVDRSPRQPASVWAIPYLSRGTGVLVRQDLLARAETTPPHTFDDVRDVAERLADPVRETYGWGAALPADDAIDNLAQVALLAYGAALFEPSGFRVTLTPPDAVPGLAALAGLYRADDGTPLAPRGVVDWSVDEVAAAFVAGRVAQTFDPGGLYRRVVGTAPRLREAIVVLPPPAGPKGWFTAAATSLFVVFDRLATSDRAEVFLERLIRPTHYERVIRAGIGSTIPPYAYATKGPFWDGDPNYPVFVANARGDPSRELQFATLGQPAPLTLPVAAVRAARVLATAARRVALGEQIPLAAALTLREGSLALAGEGGGGPPPPTPTATPLPGWYQTLRSVEESLPQRLR